MTRPMVAPEGYRKFVLQDCTVSSTKLPKLQSIQLETAFPNPAKAITCIPISNSQPNVIKLNLKNIDGQQLEMLYQGKITGDKKFFIDATKYPSGTYIIELSTENGIQSQKLIIR